MVMKIATISTTLTHWVSSQKKKYDIYEWLFSSKGTNWNLILLIRPLPLLASLYLPLNVFMQIHVLYCVGMWRSFHSIGDREPPNNELLLGSLFFSMPWLGLFSLIKWLNDSVNKTHRALRCTDDQRMSPTAICFYHVNFLIISDTPIPKMVNCESGRLPEIWTHQALLFLSWFHVGRRPCV